MRTSRTFSRHWDIETRQHELLGLDLGEGIPRTTLKYGLVLCTTWWGLWLLLLGIPPQPAAPLFLLPPVAAAYYGAKRSGTYWRRTNLLVWAIRINYLHSGVRPVLGRGRIPAPRTGLRLRTRRLGESVPQLGQLPLLGPLFAPGSERTDPAASYGPPAHLTPRVRLYGPDAVAKARAKHRTKQRPATRTSK